MCILYFSFNRQHKDVALVNLANILHRAHFSADAAILAHAALDHTTDIFTSHYTLGNIYAVSAKYLSKSNSLRVATCKSFDWLLSEHVCLSLSDVGGIQSLSALLWAGSAGSARLWAGSEEETRCPLSAEAWAAARGSAPVRERGGKCYALWQGFYKELFQSDISIDSQHKYI